MFNQFYQVELCLVQPQIGSGDITVTQLETPSFTFNEPTIQLGDSVSTEGSLRWN